MSDIMERNLPKEGMLYKALKEQAMQRYLDILKQRDEILAAFVAKYGCEPDEIEQVEQRRNFGTETVWFVRRKEK